LRDAPGAQIARAGDDRQPQAHELDDSEFTHRYRSRLTQLPLGGGGSHKS
jgi:hypothetical protein